MELSIDFDGKTLENLLLKIHKNIEKLITFDDASDLKSRPKKLDKTQLLDDLYKNQKLTGMNCFQYIYVKKNIEKEYFHIKSALAYNETDILSVFASYFKSNDLEQLQRDLVDYSYDTKIKNIEIKKRPQTPDGFSFIGEVSRSTCSLLIIFL